MTTEEAYAVFDTPWNDTYVSGGKRMNISQHAEKRDTFVGYGKERGCVESGTWWRVMQLAVGVLSADNTQRVVEETPAPSWLHIEDASNHLLGNDTPFRYTRQPYTYAGRSAYELSDDRFEEYDTTQVELPEQPFTPTEVGEAPTILKREKSLADGRQYDADKWVRERGLSMKRMTGSWWQFMCLSAEVLAAEPTQVLVEELPSRIVDESVTLDEPSVNTLDYDEKPYSFVDGAGTKAESHSSRYDF